MKKHIYCLAINAIFIALSCNIMANPLVQPVRTMEIPYAGSQNIVINGTADAAYSAEQTTDVFNPTGYDGPADYTFVFKVAYNPTYLYIIGFITDDFDNSITYTTDTNSWTYDNIEVFISLDTTGSTGSTSGGYGGDTNCIQLRINRGIDSIQTPGRATTDMYIHYWENTATGWMFETAIPWKCVLGEGQKPQDMDDYLCLINGFDLMGNDSDTPGPDHRDCQPVDAPVGLGSGRSFRSGRPNRRQCLDEPFCIWYYDTGGNICSTTSAPLE